MNFPDMEAAVKEAEITLRVADMHATGLAKLLVGRLRQVKPKSWEHTLRDLKNELRSFNARTERWV